MSGAVDGREPSVDRSEMLTSARPPSGRVAVHRVQVSDVTSVSTSSQTEPVRLIDAGTERHQLTGLDEGTTTSGDVVSTFSEDRPGVPEETECLDQPVEEAGGHQLAAEQLSLTVDNRSLEDPWLEQLENVQVAIKVFQ